MLSFLNTPFYHRHAELLFESYQRFLNEPLIQSSQPTIVDLFEADFALLSHGVEDDPIFNFGNRVALELFDYCWEEFIQLPSRFSAKPIKQAERQQLLDTVTRQGYIDNYSGIRVTRTGRDFAIEGAIVWNLTDSVGVYHGQAAMITL